MIGTVTISLIEYNELRDFKLKTLKKEANEESLEIIEYARHGQIIRNYHSRDEMNLILQKECKKLQDEYKALQNDSEKKYKILEEKYFDLKSSIEKNSTNKLPLPEKTLEDVKNMSILEFIKWAHFP